MKPEKLQSAAFEPLTQEAMRLVGGGMATGNGLFKGSSYSSDCAEFGPYGQLHMEFYSYDGSFVGEYYGPDPAPGGPR